jgi:hypothetical protein
MADGGQMLKHPAVAVAAGAAATAAGAATQLYLASERLPVLGGLLRRGRTDLARRGEQLIDQSIEPVKAIIVSVAVQMVELVLDELDLNNLVRERIDLIGLADEVIDGVDLQAIIRQSTATVSENVMSDVRTQGERADDIVSGFVDRLLGRAREEQVIVRQPEPT